MLPLAIAAAILAAAPPAPTPGKTRVLVLDLEASDVDPSRVKLVNSLITGELAHFGDLDVVSAADIRRLVELDAEKTAVGCSAESCLAELAGALGAQQVVFGSVGALGNLTIVQLNLFDTAKAQAVGRERVEVTNVEELPAHLDDALLHLFGRAPSGPSALVVGCGIASLAGAVVAISTGIGALYLDDALTHADSPAATKGAALDVGPWLIGASALSTTVAVLAGAGAGAAMVLE